MSRLKPRYFSSSGSSLANELLSELHHHLVSGTLWPQLAHQLFDEMLHQPVPVSVRALNGLFAALARAPPSAACTDGPALAIDLFNRMARAGRRRVIAPTSHTYSILIECCCLARRPDLGPSFFAHILKTGFTADVVTFSGLFKCLCDMKRTEEALDVLLHRVPHDLPNVISYSVIVKSFCDNGSSQLALDLLRIMAKKAIRSPAAATPVSIRLPCLHPELPLEAVSAAAEISGTPLDAGRSTAPTAVSGPYQLSQIRPNLEDECDPVHAWCGARGRQPVHGC